VLGLYDLIAKLGEKKKKIGKKKKKNTKRKEKSGITKLEGRAKKNGASVCLIEPIRNK